MKTHLGNGADKGSKILVTTPNETVVRIMGTLAMFSLVGLSEDHCWTIFTKRGFGNGGVEETPNLVKIGKEIVKEPVICHL